LGAVQFLEELPFSCLKHDRGAALRSSSIAKHSPFLAARNAELIAIAAEIALRYAGKLQHEE